MRRYALIFLGTCLILLAGVEPAMCKAQVEVRPHATVRGKSVQLRQIARIRSDAGYSGPQLETLPVSHAPLPGQKMVLSRQNLILSLKAGGVPLDQIRLSGSSETVILREQQTISSERIKRNLRAFILNKMPWRRKDVEIRQISGVHSLVMPAGDLTVTIHPQKGSDYLGLTPFQVILRTADGEEKRLWVNADIRVYTQVVVARHPIARLRRIAEEDLSLERRNRASLSPDTFTSVQEVVGKRTRRFIQVGDPIRLSQVEVPPVVRRGDLVTITLENEVIRITARGKVMENGRPGEMIRVRNLSSGKNLFARVIDGKTVKVVF